MEIYTKIIAIIDANLIYCLCPMVLGLMLIELLFKKKFRTKNALAVIRWIIICYTAVTLVYFITGILISPNEFAFTSRATGPYRIVYWLMLLSAVILPFSLLIKKLGSKFLYVLFIAFCMKIGFYFERFVILVTNLHRDYLPPRQDSGIPDFPVFLILFFLQGILMAVLLVFLVEVAGRIKEGRLFAQKNIS